MYTHTFSGLCWSKDWIYKMVLRCKRILDFCLEFRLL